MKIRVRALGWVCSALRVAGWVDGSVAADRVSGGRQGRVLTPVVEIDSYAIALSSLLLG